jgi:hypothetical protein
MVTLASFFDLHAQNLYPHSHDFHWRQPAKEIIEPGHSGAPILWHGHLIAWFSGATGRSYFFGLLHEPDKLTMVSIADVMSQASLCGLALDADQVGGADEDDGSCSVVRNR